MAKARTVRTESNPTQPTEITLVPDTKRTPTPINLEDEIRRRAYELYEQGGFVSGRDNEYWLTAEREVHARYGGQRQTA